MAILDTLRVNRSQFPDLINVQQAVEILNRTAWAHRDESWGLLSKPTGNNFAGKSVDILFNKTEGQIYDVLIAAPDLEVSSTATPAFNLVGPMDLARWVAPTAPGSEPTPIPIPVEPASLVFTVKGLDDLIAAVRELTQVIKTKELKVRF